ncbi:hypothetical protein OIDMADRAFT_77064, partial [Oidiodendron maius Zn]
MPSFKSFGEVMGSALPTVFEIRLEKEFIVLRGIKSEAANQLLRGVVVLCLPVPLKVEDVHLQMTGHLKISGAFTRKSTHRIDKSIEFFSHNWPSLTGGEPISTSKDKFLPPGNYEWPFELVIDGSMTETIEGLTDTYIKYNLKATVTRGKLAHDLHAWKPIRIFRTLGEEALDQAGSVMVEDVWSNKIEYQIGIPRKDVVFGTVIILEMTLTPLVKGLVVGTIRCDLHEHQEFFPLEGPVDAKSSFQRLRTVNSWDFELNDGEHSGLEENGGNGYNLQKVLHLPKQLKECLQDAEAYGIKIRHEVKLNIALHNPDGHISELRVTLPITIFISPNMPINAQGCLVDHAPQSVQVADRASNPPPLYSQHILDQLYT